MSTLATLTTMKIDVLYFATLRDRAGRRREEIGIEEELSVSELKSYLGDLHNSLAPALDTCLVAVNHEFAADDVRLRDGDEVGLFPPVSGGAPDEPDLLRVTEDPLDVNELLAGMVGQTTGAACVFTGVVRARSEKAGRETEFLDYEAYVPMAHAKLEQVEAEIKERWPAIERVAIIQRIGRLAAGTPTVLVACTAAHRDTGVFEAARYGIDRLKEIVPIWKKEIGPDGETWVEGKYIPSESDRAGK